MNAIADLVGVIPPMITPFGDDDRIDSPALAEEARFLQKSGVSGMVVGGSMGEGAGMSEQELAEATRIVVEAIDGTLPVLTGVIADTSAEAIRLSIAAREAGSSGLQIPPPHFSFSMETRILSEYYMAIGEAVGLPLIVYNVIPWAQAALEALQELIYGNPSICGVKQSGRNIHTLTALTATMRGLVRIYSAIDDMIYPSFLLGVDGTISGTSCVFPGETVEMYRAVRDGNYDDAMALHRRVTPVWRTIDHPNFPTRAKYAIHLSGRHAGKARKPFSDLTISAAHSIESALFASGFGNRTMGAHSDLV